MTIAVDLGRKATKQTNKQLKNPTIGATIDNSTTVLEQTAAFDFKVKAVFWNEHYVQIIGNHRVRFEHPRSYNERGAI